MSLSYPYWSKSSDWYERKEDETEELFKILIKDWLEMRNAGHRLCKVYWNFARFLKHKKENQEELKYLDECIAWDNNLIDSKACKFSIKCQDLLMDYSNKKIESLSETRFDSDPEAYIWDEKYYFKHSKNQRSFHSAIYKTSAIKSCHFEIFWYAEKFKCEWWGVLQFIFEFYNRNKIYPRLLSYRFEDLQLSQCWCIL